MSYELSKQEITKEILRCGKDPAYFLDNYARITHQERGIIPFKTFDFQKELLKDFHDYRYNIILKARQLGISTIVSGYISWMMLFHKEKNVLVMATKLLTAIPDTLASVIKLPVALVALTVVAVVSGVHAS